MENIGLFLAECEGLGLKKTELFQVMDLYEAKCIPLVSALEYIML